MNKSRCDWPGNDPLMTRYHDEEWEVPLHDDQKLFECIILDGAQAGLMWKTILDKREGYRKAFHNFDARKVAKYTEKDNKRLLNNAGIVRNRLKIKSAIQNAQVFLTTQKKFGSFDTYIWQFVNGKPIKNHFKKLSDLPAMTKEAEAMSKDLKKRGFNFVGPTICYAFMQAAGMVNDHITSCFRYNEV